VGEVTPETLLKNNSFIIWRIAYSNFETAKELGRFEIECSGDPHSQPFNQIRNPDAQRIRDNPHRPQRHVPLSPLDRSNIRPVQTRAVRKFLLRPSLSLAQFPDSRPNCSARIRLPSGHRRALSNSSSASSGCTARTAGDRQAPRKTH
jgi:hypothetical protein